MTSIAVIGAGPAGISAAVALAERGLPVTLFDEQQSLGGQIYRNIEQIAESSISRLGSDYLAGRDLAETARPFIKKGQIEYRPRSVIWGIDGQCLINWRADTKTYSKQFEHIVLATGAIERPVPIPGWQLPRVLTAGGAQILLKSGGPALRDAVLIGAGPLLYLVASQLIRFGSPPKALIETQGIIDQLKASKFLRPSRATSTYVLKGLRLLSEIRKAGVPRYTRAKNISIETRDDALEVKFDRGATKQSVIGSHALLHLGVVPNTQLSRALDIKHRWEPQNACFNPICSSEGLAEGADNIWIAGDGAGIMGADVARLSGEIAGISLAKSLGHTLGGDLLLVDELKRRREKYLPMRRFLDSVYRPPEWVLNPSDETLICRCEEIRAADIRRAVQEGAQGPNQAKAFTRAGMGNCQGRYCGLTVTNIIAAESGQEPEEVGYYRIRSPIKPITLKELATHERQ